MLCNKFKKENSYEKKFDCNVFGVSKSTIEKFLTKMRNSKSKDMDNEISPPSATHQPESPISDFIDLKKES